jgi:hypothetical protein
MKYKVAERERERKHSKQLKETMKQRGKERK